MAKLVDLPDGRTIAVLNHPMSDGGWVATHDDITDRQRAEQRIAHMARHDALTDLPNRVLFRERLVEALAGVGRGAKLAVFYLDLDRFKAINDTLGHPMGDDLLKIVAGRLRHTIRETDTVARVGGDEFAIIQTGIEEPIDTAILAQRLGEAVRAPYDLAGHAVVVDTSIGIAMSPGDGTDPDALLKAADMALYGAKADGRGTYRFFEPAMDLRMKSRRELEIALRQALAAGQFELHYQPLVNVDDNQIIGCEALLRWKHPERGMISPAEFIPVAEEIGLIVPLGEWVLRKACLDAASWPDDIKVAVNLSPIQVNSQNLVAVVVSALAAAGLPARRLEIEITETVLMHNTTKTMATLHQLRELGVHISMDDFGTGYSSLSYLRKFPFDKIKIDRSFISGLPSDNESIAIVRAVAGLAANLNMTATAEGVETAEQLEKVRELGCVEMQGYLFSRPLPLAQIAPLFERQPPKAREERVGAWPQLRRRAENPRVLDHGVAVGHAGDEIGDPHRTAGRVGRIEASEPIRRQIAGVTVVGEQPAHHLLRLVHDPHNAGMAVKPRIEEILDRAVGLSHRRREADHRPAGVAHRVGGSPARAPTIWRRLRR